MAEAIRIPRLAVTSIAFCSARRVLDKYEDIRTDLQITIHHLFQTLESVFAAFNNPYTRTFNSCIRLQPSTWVLLLRLLLP